MMDDDRWMMNDGFVVEVDEEMFNVGVLFAGLCFFFFFLARSDEFSRDT